MSNPEEDVWRRFERVFPVFWQQYRPHADRCLFVFNGGESFLAVAESTGDIWTIYDSHVWNAFQRFINGGEHENGKH